MPKKSHPPGGTDLRHQEVRGGDFWGPGRVGKGEGLKQAAKARMV